MSEEIFFCSIGNTEKHFSIFHLLKLNHPEFNLITKTDIPFLYQIIKKTQPTTPTPSTLLYFRTIKKKYKKTVNYKHELWMCAMKYKINS